MAQNRSKQAVIFGGLLLIVTIAGVVVYRTSRSQQHEASVRSAGESFFEPGGATRSSLASFGDLPPEVKSYLESNLEEPRAFKSVVGSALRKYALGNHGELPGSIEDLKPYIVQAPSTSLNLENWQLVATGHLDSLESGQPVFQKKQLGPGGKPAASIDASGNIEIDVPSVNGKGVFQITITDADSDRGKRGSTH